MKKQAVTLILIGLAVELLAFALNAALAPGPRLAQLLSLVGRRGLAAPK